MANEPRDLGDHSHSQENRLHSWKEIASYLKCSERTVRRWELEGLPIHRHPHKNKAAVYAYKPEIDAWWNDGRVRLERLEQSKVIQLRSRSLWLGSTLATGALALTLVGWFAYRLRGTTPRHIASLAVLPLKNLSGDPAQDYFADGMTEELTTDLGQISALRVISRTSAMQYQGSHKTLPDIARDLHVDAVVEGSVERSGDEIRITAQLIDAASDRHLWAKSYERNLRDVLALQDEVAQAIATEVRIKLTPREQIQLTSAHPVDPQAHEAYLRGMYELHGMTAETTDTLRSQSLEKAVGYFQQALTQDPNDALAYSGLADAYSGLSTHYKAPLDVMPKAKQAAAKAIELDDGLADAHASLGYVLLTYDWEWARAEHEFRRALALNASLARAHAGYAEYLLFVARRTDEALQELECAYGLDPLLPLSHGDSAWLLFLAKRYSQSIEASQRVGHDDHILALSYAELGRSQEAIAAADRASKTTQNPVILSQVAAAYALAGPRTKVAQCSRASKAKRDSGMSAVSMWPVFIPCLAIRKKHSPGLVRPIATARIDCPLPGWIPGSTRSVEILVFRIYLDELVYRISLRFAGCVGLALFGRTGS